MKRSPLKRTGRLKARQATPRRSERQHDADYMARVRELPCCARDLSPCDGAVEADHGGKKRGMGAKADDSTCIPLCHGHHMARHAFAGCFRSWTAPVMRAWLDSHIEATRARLQPFTAGDAGIEAA